MNKSLKFLAIGLALAVLLVSQVGVDRSAEAAPVSLADGKVAFTNDIGEEQDYFKPGDTVDFYINDDDLAQPTVNQKTTVVWYLDSVAPTVSQGETLNLANGQIGGDAVGSGGLRNVVFSTSTPQKTSHERYAPNGILSPDTPLVRASVSVTVDNELNGDDGDRLVTGADPAEGTIRIFGDVEGQSATGTTGTTTITVVFEYDLPDVFMKNPGEGAGAPSTENRAKVTSASDSVGEWITIGEVADEGDKTSDPTSNIYHGSIKLSDDAAATASGDDEIYVRDGETITVTFYDAGDEEVGSDTATIDAENPLISDLSPAKGAVINDSSPAVTFTVTDDGAGFDTRSPELHVDLTVMKFVTNMVDGKSVDTVTQTCVIDDDDLTATRLSRTEVEMLFRNQGSWVSGVECSGGTKLQVDATADGTNNHGRPIKIKVDAWDGADNMKSLTHTITIDRKAPEFRREAVETGVGWDGKKTKPDSASIMVVFTESLDADTVDVGDFSVDDPDATIEDVTVGGAGDDKNELVFLTLASDLPSDARPRVELEGSIKDVAGNEVKEDVVPRVRDGISPDVTVDALLRQLLPKDAEVGVSFTADENLSGILGNINENCTCLGITGGGDEQDLTGDGDVTKGDVALPTPGNGTYTFEQSAFSGTGIYGILVRASDSAANPTTVGAMDAKNEKVTVSAVSGDEVTFSLKNWPLANAGFKDSSLKQAVMVSETDGGDALTTMTGSSTTTAEVVKVDWGAGTVTMDLMGHGVEKDDTLYATYSYVDAAQVVEIDLDAPTLAEDDGVLPSGDTEEARPFITITFDETEYAGDTHTTVEVTSAVLTDPNDNDTVLVDAENDVNLLSTSDNKMFSYLPDSDLALGEYTVSVVAKDDAGNVMDETSRKFKVVARPPVTIPLNLGWNLVSLPGAAADSSIDAVINVDEVSQVLTYDPTLEGGWLAAVRVNGAFEGGLTNIEASKAYLVYTTSVDDLKVDIPGFAQGTQDFPPTIQVYKGWNMIPASSLDPNFKVELDTYLASISWTRGYFYGSQGQIEQVTEGQDEQEMVTTGRGFLIYVEEDGTLVP